MRTVQVYLSAFRAFPHYRIFASSKYISSLPSFISFPCLWRVETSFSNSPHIYTILQKTTIWKYSLEPAPWADTYRRNQVQIPQGSTAVLVSLVLNSKFICWYSFPDTFHVSPLQNPSWTTFVPSFLSAWNPLTSLLKGYSHMKASGKEILCLQSLNISPPAIVDDVSPFEV